MNFKLVLVGILLLFLVSASFAVPVQVCGGTILNKGDSLDANDQYSVRFVDIYSSGATMRVNKDGSFFTYVTVPLGSSKDVSDGSTVITVQVCGGNKAEGWAETKSSVNGQPSNDQPPSGDSGSSGDSGDSGNSGTDSGNSNSDDSGTSTSPQDTFTPTCGGSVLTSTGQRVDAGNSYTAQFAGLYSAGATFSIRKDGAFRTYVTVPLGSSREVTDGSATVTVQVCSGDRTSGTVEAKASSVIASPGNSNDNPDSGSDTNTSNDGNSDSNNSGNDSGDGTSSSGDSNGDSDSGSSSDTNTCSGTMLSNGVSMGAGNSYTAQFAGLYSAGATFSIRKDGAFRTYVTVPLGSSREVTDGSATVTVQVCSGDRTSGTVEAKASSVIASSPSGNSDALTCGEVRLQKGQEATEDGYAFNLVNTYSGGYAMVQVKDPEGAHLRYVYLKQGVSQTVVDSRNGARVTLNSCKVDVYGGYVELIKTVFVDTQESNSADNNSTSDNGDGNSSSDNGSGNDNTSDDNSSNSNNGTSDVNNSNNSSDGGSVPLVVETPTSFAVSMQPGWNIFSLPVDGSVKFGDVTSTCSGFGFRNTFVYSKSGSRMIAGVPTLFEAGKAYVFYAPASCSVTVNKPVNETATPFAFTTGWNVYTVGLTTQFNASNCEVVRGPLEYAGGQWNRVSTLEPSKAYFVKTSGSCSLN